MKKAALITGGATGTGYAIARRFAGEGFDIYITSRTKETADEAAARLAQEFPVFAKGLECAPVNQQEIEKMFEDIDADDRIVETVVLNAANLAFGTDPAKGIDPFTTTADEFREVLDTNILWDFLIAREAAKRMREINKGALVFIASNTAYRAIPNRTAYCASKGGMLALSRALAIDFGPYGIRSNAVLPGTIKTKRWEAMAGKQIVNGKQTPIGDISDFEDIANAAYFLGSDLSKNVTGAELTVDGGMTCQLYPREKK